MVDSVKVSFEDTLSKCVVNMGKCVACDACVVVCPFHCLEYIDEKPFLVKTCRACGICAKVCPQYKLSMFEIENFVFGRERRANEVFGIYRRLAIAKAVDNKILEVCQDGGAVTALLLFGLKKRIIDGAIVTKTKEGKPLYPHSRLAKTYEEILQSAGTKYFFSHNILTLADMIKQKKTNVAFVGTPCQICAIRKMQIMGLKKYVAPLKLLIGLACSECFEYEGLMEKLIHGKLGVDLNRVKRISVKDKMTVTLDSETLSIPLAEAKQHARKACSFCGDFSSELADISVCGLGLKGWSFVILRTEKGENFFSRAEKAGAISSKNIDVELNALNLLNKLSKKKRQIAGKGQNE